MSRQIFTGQDEWNASYVAKPRTLHREVYFCKTTTIRDMTNKNVAHFASSLTEWHNNACGSSFIINKILSGGSRPTCHHGPPLDQVLVLFVNSAFHLRKSILGVGVIGSSHSNFVTMFIFIVSQILDWSDTG